jgi:hypothetical protein
VKKIFIYTLVRDNMVSETSDIIVEEDYRIFLLFIEYIYRMYNKFYKFIFLIGLKYFLSYFLYSNSADITVKKQI